MYDSKPTVVYGFHGIDKDSALNIVAGNAELFHSKNKYDWLGEGVYFWENNLERAHQYAKQDSGRPSSRITNPYSLGAVLELGNCLDLLDQKHIGYLKLAYELMVDDLQAEGKPLPKNEEAHKNDFDFKKRNLDCAVISYACALAEQEAKDDENARPFDSVRAAFIEGYPIYDGAMFHEETHIQIAIRNPDCIKGIFLPREAGKAPVYAAPK